MRKWIVDAGRNLLVASLEKGSLQINSTFSFQINNADCIAIADAIDECILMRNSEEKFLLQASFQCGNVCVHKFSGPTCSIIVNNCRVVYHGDTDRLKGLPNRIRKSYNKFILSE